MTDGSPSGAGVAGASRGAGCWSVGTQGASLVPPSSVFPAPPTRLAGLETTGGAAGHTWVVLTNTPAPLGLRLPAMITPAGAVGPRATRDACANVKSVGPTTGAMDCTARAAPLGVARTCAAEVVAVAP